MRSGRSFALLLSVPLLGCSSAPPDVARRSPTAFPIGVALPPGVSRVVRVEPYQIAGSDSAELLRSMAERGPRPFVGRTDWDVRWTYRVSRRAGGCRVEDVRVGATVTIIVPRWAPRDSAALGPLLGQWNVFLAALTRHEEGHRDIALEGATAVQHALRDVRTTTCATLAPELDRRGREVLARWRARDAEYDRTTRHGETQGARWSVRRSAAGP